MTEPVEHISMKLHRFTEKPLASRSTALTIAEMVIRELSGEDGLKRQQPLKITEMSDRWNIEGGRDYEPMEEPFEQTLEGPIIIEILKDNCQVVRLSRMAIIGPPPKRRRR